MILVFHRVTTTAAANRFFPIAGNNIIYFPSLPYSWWRRLPSFGGTTFFLCRVDRHHALNIYLCRKGSVFVKRFHMMCVV
jgi:hypothetical protein